MAFAKTGISILPPRPVKSSDQALQPGDKRGGKVWDGERWVDEEVWLAAQKKNGG